MNKLDKTFFEVVEIDHSDDLSYWLSRPPRERLEAIEVMRKTMFGHDRVSARLQRVLTVSELSRD